jgi:hypothetical protein
LPAGINLILFRWLAMDVTTVDVKVNCEDLKVLGKGDFKTLMKWRLKLREEVCIRQFFGMASSI